MKKLAKAIIVLASSLLLISCVVDDSYSTDYYSNGSDTYDSTTTGYNRDYHHNRSNYQSAGSADNRADSKAVGEYESSASSNEPAEDNGYK